MNDYTQRRLEEFDARYAKAGIIGDRKFEEYLPNTFQDIKSFLSESIHHALAGERERVVDWLKAEKATYSEDVAQRERAVYDHIIKCFVALASVDTPLPDKE